MNKKNIFRLLMNCLFFALPALVFSEPFRVAALHIIELKEDTEFSQTKELALNDALAIYLPEERLFLHGIELKMEIPELTAQWPDCAACYIYENIHPLPNEGQIDFSGNKIFFNVLPGRLSWILQIPVQKENNLRTNQYTTKLNVVPDLSDNLIFLRLQQVMKGIPDEVMDSHITITVRPILSDRGKLNISALEPDGTKSAAEDCTFFVDEEPVSLEQIEEGLFLKNGIHTVNVLSEAYRTEVRTVRIDRAKITDLQVVMKSIQPTMIITAPEGTLIFLDDEEFFNIGAEFVISEGEHRVKFIIGDYEIVRSVSVSKGKTYRANLAVDLQVSEDE